MFENRLKGQTVLVTGLAGAKGTWLGWYLLAAGVEKLVGVDRSFGLPGTCYQSSGLGEDERVQTCELDVRDLEGLQRVMQTEKVSAALHLAAMAIVGECKQRPLDTYAINVLGTATFLEAVRRCEVPRAVVVTTDKVYRDKGGEPWTEDDPLVATGPYAVSKACAEFITRDYYTGYLQPAGQHLGIARAGNVLVPGDHHAGRIFVDVALALSRGEQPIILNPAFTRPYTFVGDTVTGYLSLLAQCDQPPIDGQAFNFGPREGRGVPNGDLATMMCDLWGSGLTWKRGSERDEPFVHQSLDCAKADRLLGWRPAFELRDGLAAVVEWYKRQAQDPTPGALRELTGEVLNKHVKAASTQKVRWTD